MELNRGRSISNISDIDFLCQIFFNSIKDDINRLIERYNADIENMVDKINNTAQLLYVQYNNSKFLDEAKKFIEKLPSLKIGVLSTDETREENQARNIVKGLYKQGQDEKPDYKYDARALVRLPMEDKKSEDESRAMALIECTRKNEQHSKRTNGVKTFQSPQSQTHKELAGQASDIKLLLIGSLGNGKSATANTILGMDIFHTSSSYSTTAGDITATIGKGSTIIDGRTVEIIDGPGISVGKIDTHFIDDLKKGMDKSLELCDYAFSAILLVLKFGIRFTMQESETIRLIKSFLGKNVIRDFGICVITFGDSFEYAVEEAYANGENLTFKSWCRSQTGEVKALFEECSYRCVLFDNKTKDKAIRRTQAEKLLNYASQNKRYSKDQFAAINWGLNELRLEARVPEINVDIRHCVEMVTHDVNTAHTRHRDNHKNHLLELENLFEEVRQKRSTVERELNGSSSLNSSLLPLSVLENDISRRIREVKILKDDKDKRKKYHSHSISQNLSYEVMSKTDKRYDRPSSTALSNKRDLGHTDRKGTARK